MDRNVRVLIVDDNIDFATELAVFATKIGHEARTARSEEEALQVVDTFTPNILVVDWKLRGVANGGDVAVKLKEKLGAEIRTIAITGYPTYVIEGESSGYNLAAILQKPIDLVSFRTELEAELAR